MVEAGVQVVGRTRFCIHPADKVAGITVVGGTKTVDSDLVRSLRPDLIVLDQEENPREMTEISPDRWWASRVTSLADLLRDGKELSEAVESDRLWSLIQPLEEIIKSPRRPLGDQPPAMLLSLDETTPWEGEVPYVIWKDPWMVVNRGTFISSMLWRLGVDLRVPGDTDLYPRVSESWLREGPALFSSEPFPFGKKADQLRSMGLRGWIVDGESLSWFGVRAVRFLTSVNSPG